MKRSNQSNKPNNIRNKEGDNNFRMLKFDQSKMKDQFSAWTI